MSKAADKVEPVKAMFGAVNGKGGFNTVVPVTFKPDKVEYLDSLAVRAGQLADSVTSGTKEIAAILDEYALTMATKGKSKADKVKSGQQTQAYKDLSVWLKEQKGLDPNSSAIRVARHRAKKAAGQTEENNGNRTDTVASRIKKAVSGAKAGEPSVEQLLAALAEVTVALRERSDDLTPEHAPVLERDTAVLASLAIIASQHESTEAEAEAPEPVEAVA